uniref:V-set and transmembrane domain containing 4a n=1 Tax=Oryzias latipes TaxID=8090 RepID=A0A3P9HC66_ORYLA
MVTEKDNLTLSCLVSQRKRSNSFLILRWFFSPLTFPSLTGIRKLKLYGNYTRRFPHPKFHLHDEEGGEIYRLLILNLTGMDQGFYSCKVQEIRKYKNTWRSSSNGTSTIQLKVHFTPEDGSVLFLICVSFLDVYVCVVIICSLGLLSIFMFTVVLTCQYLHRRHRLKASYLLVRCPESSSGETVTSSSSCSSSSPRTPRKENGQKTNREIAVKPKPPEEPPIYIPPKVPVAAKRPQKPRRLKTQPRRSPREESLTYAELELVRPRKELPRSSSPEPTDSSPDTVYAQILFQENHL